MESRREAKFTGRTGSRLTSQFLSRQPRQKRQALEFQLSIYPRLRRSTSKCRSNDGRFIAPAQPESLSERATDFRPDRKWFARALRMFSRLFPVRDAGARNE